MAFCLRGAFWGLFPYSVFGLIMALAERILHVVRVIVLWGIRLSPDNSLHFLPDCHEGISTFYSVATTVEDIGTLGQRI